MSSLIEGALLHPVALMCPILGALLCPVALKYQILRTFFSSHLIFQIIWELLHQLVKALLHPVALKCQKVWALRHILA